MDACGVFPDSQLLLQIEGEDVNEEGDEKED